MSERPAPGPTRRCGVLGDPIAHSLSPALHRAGYAELGLDWEYDAHRVAAGGLADFLAGTDDSWRGLSLTMPLKREAVPLAGRLTDRARAAGAVNTLLLEADQIVGDNTDLPGAAAAVRERTAAPLRSAVVLGGGATATSVGLALAGLGVTSIDLAVRDVGRAEETVRTLRAHPAAPEVATVPLAEPGRVSADVVVSTIPASAQTPGLVDRFVPPDGHPLVVFEALYDPWPTPLAEAASTRGAVLVGGLDLLVHQAALQLTLFTGEPAPLEAMRAAGEAALAARRSG